VAKLPGALELGGLPSPDPSRPIGVSEVGGIGRGGAAFAEAGRTLAAGLDKLGEGMGALALDRGRYEYTQASAERLTRKIELSTRLEGDTDYATMPERYGQDIGKINEEAAARISVPGLRERFLNEAATDTAKFNAGIHGRARQLWGDETKAHVSRQGNTFIEQAIASPDDETRRQIVDAHAAQIDGLQAVGVYTPQQALAEKRDFAKRYATAMWLARADQDPDSVINELRAKPGSAAAITGRILQNEGYGRNPRSSADGEGQFINSTWLDVLKRNRPDLANGRTDQQLLALRADRALGKEMTEAYRAENEAYLRGRGHAATPGQQYLAHFLGAGGADAVLKANPNLPVEEALAQAVGPGKAKAMIDANPEILRGKLSGSVAAWADRKMGGSDGGGIHAFLPPEIREQILQRAYTAKHKRTAEDLTAFKARVQDSTAEAMATGQAKNPLTEEDFNRSLGHEQGAASYKAYQAQLTLGADMQRLAEMDPAEQRRLFESYAPQADSPGYADALKRQDVLGKAIEHVTKERDKDPAGFAIRRLPVVRDSYEAFSKVVADPTAPIEQKQAAARDFATKTDMEQARLGIPANLRSIVPKEYIEGLATRIDNPRAAGGTQAVVQMIDYEKQLWGNAWPAIYRQLGNKAGPVAQVIGSGVSPRAGQILADLSNVTLDHMLKDQTGVKRIELTNAVVTRFKPFLSSLEGHAGGVELFNTFRGQAEKLAAHYVLRGSTANDAALQAYKELITDKYEFRQSIRIPKAQPLSADQIELGAREALNQIASLDVMPDRDNVRGLTPDYLQRDTERRLARDGKWVTAPDEAGNPERGVWLVYGGEVVVRKDGKPVFLTWQKLGELAGERNEAWRQLEGGGTRPVAMP
jgi:hypothetical protein